MNDAASSAASLLPVALAQLPEASQSQIMTVLLGGAALLVIANQVMTLVSKLRAKPEPAEVATDRSGVLGRMRRDEPDRHPCECL